jgi:WD40 repeat protein
MQRLEREAAIKAVRGPVEKLRPFAAGVAEKLVDDLSTIKVKRPDGTIGVQPGQYVEPVQLQVVCQSLWERLPEDGNQITSQNLDELGDVNKALETYYDERVKAAADDHISEREIREWFQNELITSGNTRNIVPDESIASDEFKMVVQKLEGNLIRTEPRAGQNWYELSHDRLIEPIIQSNEKWFAHHLSLFQRQVVLWTQQERSDNLLLRGEELLEAEREAVTLTLTPEEDDFLNESRLLRRREQRDRLLRYGIIAALVISLLFLGYSVFQYRSAKDAQAVAEQERENAQQAEAAAKQSEEDAINARDDAEKQKRLAEEQASRALAGSLAAQANTIRNTDHVSALLLGIEAYKREPSLLTRTTLFQLLQYTPYVRQFAYNGPVTSVAVNPAGNVIASASCKEYNQSQCAYGEIVLSDALTHQVIQRISDEFGSVSSLAFNEDGTILAAGGCVPVDENDKGCTDGKGQYTLWNVTDPVSPVLLSESREWHAGLVKSIAFSPDGRLLASGGFDKRIVLWDVSDPTNPTIEGIPLLGHSSFVNGLAFSVDGNTLVSAGDDRTFLIWNISNPNNAALFETLAEAHTESISSIAFSPDGQKFASAGDDRVVILWDWDPDSRSLQKSLELKGHTGFVKSVAFNKDGTRTILASAGFDNKVILWDTTTGEQIGPPLDIHTKAINAITFGSATNDGIVQPYLVSVSDDRTSIQWDLFSRNPPSGSLNLASSAGWTPVSTADTYPVGSQTLSFEIDGQTVRLSNGSDEYLILEDFAGLVQDLYLDGEHLITRDENDSVLQWNINPDDWVHMACDAAKRNLDPGEWRQYLPNTDPEKTCAEYP